MESLRFEEFTVPGRPGDSDERVADWVRATDLGFYDKERDAEAMQRVVDALRARGTRLVGVYDDGAAPPSLAATLPVATFAEFAGEFTVGPNAAVPAHQISDVTVRATHRRRGLLRRMLEDSLSRAAAAGAAVAVLTASEAGIYGRFGFSPAAHSQPVRVDVRSGLRLRPEARALVDGAGGRVVDVHPRDLAGIHDAVFAGFHAASRGSVTRSYDDVQRVTGRWGPDGRGAADDLRGYAYHAADGRPLGFATARFGGWDKTPKELRVVDLVAGDPAAELALWDHLGAHDLVQVLTFGRARVDDPLRWALADPRDVKTRDVEDSLWVRPLDLPAIVRASEFAADGRIVLDVEDSLGYVDGTWVLTVDGGAASVRRAGEGAPGPAGAAETVRVGVETLGSLLTGAIEPWQAEATGRLAGGERGAAAMRRIFGGRPRPMNHTFF
ncbi:GNAT family N-acetyltransferase [Zhihengliuella salsuginis]|uniref:UPF0256 protein n=1 Tax=Zhihengliuella salsuginis TaxID=578222 RepID=A0ABQ3GEH1_9MICC|nr:GNAT family N-acetyltransferase [Zhihengliuella salsuginis]GHD01469.1 UPF0256 protein [Zhihengliuella salsuginis]